MIQTSAYGRLTRDPKLIKTINGKDMATGAMACDATGFADEEERTIFYNLTAFNFLALSLARLKKGDLLSVMGKVVINRWKDGEGKEQERHQIMVESLSSAKMVKPYTGKKQPTQKQIQAQMDFNTSSV